jgi:signal transduction histidine kinase
MLKVPPPLEPQGSSLRTWLFYKRFIALLFLLFVGGLSAMAWIAFQLEGALVESLAVNDAAFHSSVLKEFRTLYTSEVVERVRSQGIEATHDYQLHRGHIPLPVTFSLLLSKRLDQESGSDVRLYSNHPFPWREDGGPRDTFERDALAHLEANPSDDFVRFVEEAGGMAVRYATADRMRPSCVSCHNTHPDSPKRDWKVDDVRGVLSVTHPLQPDSAEAATGLRAILLMFLGTALVGLLVFALSAIWLRQSAVAAVRAAAAIAQSHAELQTEIAERQRAQRERGEFEEQMHHTQKLESIGLLAGGIAHDFNNLLQGIVGQAELTRRMLPEDHPGRSRLDQLVEGATGASGLTGQLLAYAGRGVRERVPTDVRKVIEGVAPLAEAASRKRTPVQYELTEDCPVVNADPAQLQQIVLNLITNALDAISECDAGAVQVRTHFEQIDTMALRGMLLGNMREPGQYVTVEVQDNGVGMSSDARSRMFDPFFTTKRDGRGLGLAAVQGIVNSHGGAMLVDSHEGKGTVIRVSLPAVCAPADADDHAEVSSVFVDGRGLVALVIDDEPQVRLTTAGFLRLCGFDVIEVSSGEEGLEVVGGGRHDVALVVLDGQMPGLSGEETLVAIHARQPKLPALFYSGYDIASVRERMSDHQYVQFLEKPFTMETFCRQLAKLEPCFRPASTEDNLYS